MTFTPISNTVPQYSKNAGGASAAGYFLKFYADGTTTPISMATDSTGGTLLAKCELDTLGYPTTDGSAIFIPHIDQTYKLALYTNATDADNNTLASAAWVVDALSAYGAGTITNTDGTSLTPVQWIDRQAQTFETVADLVAATELNAGDYVIIQNYNATSNSGPMFGKIVVNGTGVDDGGAFINLTGSTTQFQQHWVEGEINVKKYGALGDGLTDDTLFFNKVVAYVNAHGTNGVYTGDGFKLKIPRGTYSLLNGLDSVTVDGVHWQGDGPDATFINAQNDIIFEFGEGNVFIDSCSVRDLSVVCDSAVTPSADLKVTYMRHGTRLTLDNIKIIRIPTLLYAYADASESISNIKISNIVGQQYDAGRAFIECFKDVTGYTAGAGAGLYLNSIRVNLDGVTAPPEDDGNIAHTATAGAVGLFMRGFWDTIICDEVIFNRHYKGIHFQAESAGFGITNTYFSNTILDYMGENAIHLQALGGNITKFNFEHGWINSSDGDGVSVIRTGGLLDMITISDTDYLMSGLHNNDVDNGCSNIRFIDNRFYGCGRKQLTTAFPTKTSNAFNIGSDCDGLLIRGNTYRDGFSYYGAGSLPLISGDYDPNYGVNLTSVAMQMEIRDNKMRGRTAGYSWTASNLLATGNTEYRSYGNNYNDDNTKAEYLGFGGAAIAASPATETNRTGCQVTYYFRSGTITDITVNGQVVANSTNTSVTIDHSDIIEVTYTAVPTVVRQLMN